MKTNSLSEPIGLSHVCKEKNIKYQKLTQITNKQAQALPKKDIIVKRNAHKSVLLQRSGNKKKVLVVRGLVDSVWHKVKDKLTESSSTGKLPFYHQIAVV